MAKIDFEKLLADRGPQQPVLPASRQVERVRGSEERLSPQERRVLMLKKAEHMGIVTETEAMLGLVKAVEGFTNMAAVYKVPDRALINAEQMRGARTEMQARGRAWDRLHGRQRLLDGEMRESGTGYVRPSDWFRLFAALKKATKPDAGVPHVFIAESPTDRSAFRAWADQYGLDGDGLVRVAKMLRADQEAKARGSFNVDAFIEKIQALSAKQLHEVIRAGFETDDIFVRSDEGSSIPLKRLPARYSDSQIRERETAIRTETDRRVNTAPPLGNAMAAKEFRTQTLRTVVEEYDAHHFDAVFVDRSSVGHDGRIVSNVFATLNDNGNGERIGCGYHGIIEPELLAAVPKGYVYEERGRPRVRDIDGKTVVDVQRWLINKKGVGLMPAEEIVQGNQVAALEQAATQQIADAIVYNIEASPRSRVGNRADIFAPFYWSDVHWVYKKLVENRLPFLAKLAGVDYEPIGSFVGEDAENEWMHNRILSSHVTTAKQLDDMRSHFLLTLEDVFLDDGDRAKIREVEKQYPESVRLGGNEFSITYEKDSDGKRIARGVIAIERSTGFDNNAHLLERAVPSEVPTLGTKENPVPLVFRFRDVSFSGMRVIPQEFTASNFRELLAKLQPQERFLDQAWRDFSGYDSVGKMRIPLTITVQDAFPTLEQLRIVMSPNPETVRYVVDRDGVEHFAHIALQYVEGDTFQLHYAQTQKNADDEFAHAKEKHAQRVVVFQSRSTMDGNAQNEQLKNVLPLQAELGKFVSEFDADNLVAFVLGTSPYSEQEKQRVKGYVDEGDIARAEIWLQLKIRERAESQSVIDAMRKVAETITELEKLGFDWWRFNYNSRNRDSEYARQDSSGFYPGDIRLHKNEIFHSSMGRVTGHRMDLWRLQRELPDLQRRLDRELEVLKLKKEALRGERSGAGVRSDRIDSGPEVIHRGSHGVVDDDGDDF